jgi:N-acetylglutamate synthase-like GNAT family acetyltransferase
VGGADEAASSSLVIRRAQRKDVPAIIRMLADDRLGSQRERYAEPLPEVYWRAFEQIDADPMQELVVVEDRGRIAGTLQLTFLP